jgi:hypothetical protein
VARPVAAGDARAVQQQRYGLLLITILLSLAVQGIAAQGELQQLVVTLLAGATTVLAVRAAGLGQRVVGLAAVLTVVMLAFSIVSAAGGEVGEGTVRTMNALVVALGPPAVAIGVARELRASGQVRVAAVLGVLSLYMLLGMLFAFTYGAIDKLDDVSFFAGGQPATTSNCLYFSFTTLTTVGYGDFVAGSDLGHTLAVFEALLGQIYLVTIVSVLVSNLGRPARRPREG